MTLEEAYRYIKASYVHHSGERNAVFLPQAEKIAMECIQRMIDVEKAKQCNIDHDMSFEAHYCYVQDLVNSANERLERTLNYGETNEYRIAELKSAIRLEEQLLGYLTELKEAKRLLRLAIEDIDNARHGINCGICGMQSCDINNAKPECKYRWQYADEAEKLLKEN